jgi:uncharacterized protein YqeY
VNELQARLVEDMKAAMKAGERDRLGVIRLMIAALKDAQLHQSTDEMSLGQEQAVLRKMIKSRRDSIDQAQKAARDDIAERESAEIVVIEAYLPQAMDPAELRAKVRELAGAIGYSGKQDTGRFMKEWMARYQGLAEGRDVQAALRELD